MRRKGTSALAFGQVSQQQQPSETRMSEEMQGQLALAAISRASIEHGSSMQIGPFQFGKLGLDVAGSPTYEQWRSIGDTLLFMATGSQWWIGDWLAYGDRQWGKTYDQIAEETGRKKQTLYNYVWVATNVQFSLRRENLSFEHHKIVAGLAPHLQAKFLSQADEENWSTRRLQEAVNPTALPDKPDPFERKYEAQLHEYLKAGESEKANYVALWRRLLEAAEELLDADQLTADAGGLHLPRLDGSE